jgi:ribosomal-protein-alanine N-acetyltransferase
MREGAASDLHAIIGLERATERAPHWQEAVYKAILDGEAVEARPQRRLFVAETEDGELAGFAVGMVQPSGEVAEKTSDRGGRRAELESVVVAESARRKGVGRGLCGEAIEWCRTQGAGKVFLEVRAGSSAAIALYAGLGFEQVGSRPRYYSGPEEDAVIMRLKID